MHPFLFCICAGKVPSLGYVGGVRDRGTEDGQANRCTSTCKVRGCCSQVSVPLNQRLL